MPVFIGVGETDNSRKNAQEAAEFYRKHSADATLEIFEGMGHAVDTNNQALRTWLSEHGPLRYAAADLREAQKLEEAGRLGAAHAEYARLTRLSDEDKSCLVAAEREKAIALTADQQLAAAGQLVANKDYAHAVQSLRGLADRYAGSVFGRRAAEELQALEDDPEIQAQVRQANVNAEADALEARAAAAEKEEDYAKAIELYQQYVEQCAKATRYSTVREHLEELKADAAVQQRIRHDAARTDCRKWLNLARNYANAGMADRADAYLSKIIDKYPDTEWAAKAKEQLQKIAEQERD